MSENSQKNGTHSRERSNKNYVLIQIGFNAAHYSYSKKPDRAIADVHRREIYFGLVSWCQEDR